MHASGACRSLVGVTSPDRRGILGIFRNDKINARIRELGIMTQAPDEHLLAVEEEAISPVIVVVTILLGLLFLIGFLYRFGVTFF